MGLCVDCVHGLSLGVLGFGQGFRWLHGFSRFGADVNCGFSVVGVL